MRERRVGGALDFMGLCCMLFLVFVSVGGDAVKSLAYVEHEEVFTGELLYENLKDLTLDSRTTRLTSVSNDPWLELEMSEDYANADVEIAIDSLSSPTTMCQVFYSDSNAYAEESSVATQIMEGVNHISIDGVGWRYLRVDLTNESNVQIELSSIRVVSRSRSIAFLTVQITALCIALFAAIRFVIRNYEEIVRKAAALRIFVSKHPIIVLCMMVMTSFLLCYHSFLFGDKHYVYADTGSDTLYQYQAFFQSVIDAIKNNNVSDWIFQYGLGSASYYWTYLLDPMALISIATGLLFGYDALLISFAWTQGVKIICCALLCYGFLKEYKTSCFSRVTAAYIYAFNGFIICWGQHYHFATAFTYFTLSLFAAEKVTRYPKKLGAYLLFAGAIALQALQSYYFTYMSLLAEGLYVLIRLVVLYGKKGLRVNIIKCGLGLLGAVVLGIGMACTSFLPNVIDILTTSNRITGGKFLDGAALWNSSDHNITILCRLLSNNLQGIGNYHGYSNYYEAEQIYYSCFMPIFFPAFVAGKKGDRKGWGLRFLLVVLIFVALFSNITGTVFNAFVANMGRYTFVLMPVFAVISAKGIENLLSADISIGQIGAVASIYIMAVVICDSNAWHIKEILLIALLIAEIAIFLTACTLYQRRQERGKLPTMMVCALLVMLNVSIETYLTVNWRTTIDDVLNIACCEQETKSVKNCIASIVAHDDTFYRIEKVYNNYTGFNDALIEGYSGISVYNSTNNAGVNKFMSTVWPKLLLNSTGAYHLFTRDFNNADMAALMGVKYIISNSKTEVSPYYKLLFGTEDGKYVYENIAYTGFANFYSKTICESDFLELNEEDMQQILQDTLLVSNGEQLDDYSSTASATIDLHAERGNRLIGSVNADDSGYLFFPIPNNQGWSAIVDGEEVEIVAANYGFIAIKVDEGQHNFELEYERPYAKMGTIISATGVLVFFSLSLPCFLRKRKEKIEIR